MKNGNIFVDSYFSGKEYYIFLFLLQSQLSEDIKVDEEDNKEEDKVIPVLEQNDGVKEEEEDMEDDTAEAERPEIRAINLEEQRALAKNLEKIGGDKWKVLAKKLGFQSDEVRHS